MSYSIELTIIKHTIAGIHVLYSSGYKTDFCSFQNNPKNLDPSFKTDLDLRNCLGRVKLVLQQLFLRLI